ncbi:MAG: ABC transporter ATP-binding protein, partial [Verrucomicrobiota bacterium]|nr:ABC transporter ATP-binding protein [Verrucomicrobiota bacterium]
IPLTPGPGATLGPEIKIDLPRPRDRKQLMHSPRFKEIRATIIEFLLKSNSKRAGISRKLVLPDLEPEDLTVPRNVFGRRTPIRRREIKTVEVP